MKQTNQTLTHSEIMDGLTYCFRELLQHEVSHRNMPNIINRAKAAAAVVTSVHREEIMEARRQSAHQILTKAIEKPLKKLERK